MYRQQQPRSEGDCNQDKQQDQQSGYQDAIGFADSLQPETDSPLEDTLSFNSRCEFLQSCLDTALVKSLKIIADERTETRNKDSNLTTGQEAKQSEQPDT